MNVGKVKKIGDIDEWSIFEEKKTPYNTGYDDHAALRDGTPHSRTVVCKIMT